MKSSAYRLVASSASAPPLSGSVPMSVRRSSCCLMASSGMVIKFPWQQQTQQRQRWQRQLWLQQRQRQQPQRRQQQQDVFSSLQIRTMHSFRDYAKERTLFEDLQPRQQRQMRWLSSSSDAPNVYTPEQRKEDHNHCVEMVRTRDFEGYLCGLLMPSSAREAFFALRAFNIEIASIKDASRLVGGRARGSRSTTGVSKFEDNNIMGEEGMGDSSLASRLRMQWWRDAISEIYENMDNHTVSGDSSSQQQKQSQHDTLLQSLTSSRRHNPTLRSLNSAIQTHNLTHRSLRRIMEAREMDLEVMQYPTVRDVARYGEDTVSSVLYLSLECVGLRDEACDNVASDIGVSLGILTALRSTGFRATQGECSIPSDVALKHDVSMDTLWRAWDASITSNDVERVEAAAESKEALQNAAREMADIASFHIHRARDNQSSVPKEGRPCLLPAVCGLQYLDSLREANYDVLHPSLVGGGGEDLERKRRLGLMFLLGRTWLTGTF